MLINTNQSKTRELNVHQMLGNSVALAYFTQTLPKSSHSSFHLGKN